MSLKLYCGLFKDTQLPLFLPDLFICSSETFGPWDQKGFMWYKCDVFRRDLNVGKMFGLSRQFSGLIRSWRMLLVWNAANSYKVILQQIQPGLLFKTWNKIVKWPNFFSLLEYFGISLMSYSYFFPLMSLPEVYPKEHLIYGILYNSIRSTNYGMFQGGGIRESKNLG